MTTPNEKVGPDLVRGTVRERYAAAPRKRAVTDAIDPERFRPLRWPVYGALVVFIALLVAGLTVRVPLETPAVVTSSTGAEVSVMTASAHKLTPGSTVTVEIEGAGDAEHSATVQDAPETNIAVLKIADVADLAQAESVTLRSGSTPILLAVIEG